VTGGAPREVRDGERGLGNDAGGSASPRPASHSLGRRRARDAAALATWAALGVFVVSLLAASVSYPGGSWTAPAENGFSISRNFWCDLLRSQAINGADNGRAKQLASVAFAALGVGLWPYWWLAASVLPGARRRWVLQLGTVSAACLAAMALFPSDRFPIAHGVVALCGGVLGMWAACVSVATRSLAEPRVGLRRAAGTLVLIFAASNALLYVYVAYLRGPETVAQPIAQKLATLALLVWMSSTVQQARRLHRARVEPCQRA
jgi:hypothetical protein